MTEICRLGDLAATGAREIVLTRDGARFPVFVVQCGDLVLGYVNSCPHARLPLNWKQDAFFDISRGFLLCANHGAHFDVLTGLCTRGPCKGKSLVPFAVRLDGEAVVAV